MSKTIRKSLGGERLGSGGAMDVEMNNFERSTHNLSQDFYTSMGVGTLNVVDCQLGLMGDTFYIDPKIAMFTLPTTLPSFARYEMRVDYIKMPIRLLNAQLMMNNWQLGRDVAKVKYPMMELQGVTPDWSSNINPNEQQIAPTSLLNQMGIVGLGHAKTISQNTVKRLKNAMPLMTYWRIYKDYYANKQEGVGYVITTEQQTVKAPSAFTYLVNNDPNDKTSDNETAGINTITEVNGIREIHIYCENPVTNFKKMTVKATLNTNNLENMRLEELFYNVNMVNNTIDCSNPKGNISCLESQYIGGGIYEAYFYMPDEYITGSEGDIKLQEFPLDNIEEMTKRVFKQDENTPLIIGGNDEAMPYAASVGTMQTTINGKNVTVSRTYGNMSGLGIKTYKSDWFNNWLDTEQITGDNGINALSSIDTSKGSFSMDAFNIGMKLWKMNNRIALSGGTINDWREVQYGERAFMAAESPIYCGSSSVEVEFDLVISNAASEGQPLGTLGGRGVTDKQKYNNIEIHCDEECIIMGIASITPRIVYSQGNEWMFDIETMADLHVPSLDGIAFQELNTEWMCAWDTEVDEQGNAKTKSVGLQCSWQEYMTRVDRASGEFAQENNLMVMTNNRQYGWDPENGEVLDFTTYIDPTKHVNQFANGRLDSQNFWAVIRKSTKARRKMAAKQIPNI